MNLAGLTRDQTKALFRCVMGWLPGRDRKIYKGLFWHWFYAEVEPPNWVLKVAHPLKGEWVLKFPVHMKVTASVSTRRDELVAALADMIQCTEDDVYRVAEELAPRPDSDKPKKKSRKIKYDVPSKQESVDSD